MTTPTQPAASKLDGKALTLLALFVIPVIGVFLFVDPYPQPAEYYVFADARKSFGIANFWNVASNLLFLVFGLEGLRLLLTGRRLVLLPGLHTAYIVLFAGIALTALGSGWFHLSPRNDTLYWDRLPMTITFMPLFAIIIGENISEKLAIRLVWPLLLSGIFAVLWWDYTESIGAGDLRLYGLVQFLPLLLIPMILLLYRSVFNSVRFYWIALGLYGIAKLFEQMDAAIFSAGGIISGHSMKHIAASLVPLVLLVGMRNRRYRASSVPPASQTTSRISFSPAARNFGGQVARSSVSATRTRSLQ